MCVLIIGWLYLLPQLQGAGLALTTLTALPAWIGIAAAGVIVLPTVIGGGMRSITFVQAFQYWLKLTALLVPALVVRRSVPVRRAHVRPARPAGVPGADLGVGAHRRGARGRSGRSASRPAARSTAAPVAGRGAVGARAARRVGPDHAGVRRGHPGAHPGRPAATDRAWLVPMSGDKGNQLLEIYSILIAGFLGTMGLPHVLVRFYTNADGRAARRTTVVVLAMIGGVYFLVTLLGALSRFYTPQLLVSGQTDAAILLVPTAALGPGWPAGCSAAWWRPAPPRRSCPRRRGWW